MSGRRKKTEIIDVSEVVDGTKVPDQEEIGEEIGGLATLPGTSASDALPQFQGQLHAVVHQSFEGPLPSPAALEGYEGVVPGAAERILRMAEESAEHQRTITTAALSAQTGDVRRGQWFARF